MPKSKSTKTTRGQPPPEYAALVGDLKREADKAESRRSKQKPGVAALLDKGPASMATLTLPTTDGTPAPPQQSADTLVPKELPQFGTTTTARTASTPSKPGGKMSKSSSQGAAHIRPFLVTVCCCVGVLLLVTAVVTLVFHWRESQVRDRSCRTEGCLRYSKALLDSMNLSTDPCQDFGQYVCGRYSHPMKLSVQQEAILRLRDELTRPAQNASLIGLGQNELQRTWRFLKSCLDVMEASIDNVGTVVDMMNEAGIHWPTPSREGDVDVLQAMVFLATQMGWPSIFQFSVHDDFSKGKQIRVNPSKPTKNLLAQRRRRVRNMTTYGQFFEMLVRNFRRDSNSTSELTFDEMLTIEERHLDFDAFSIPGGELVSFEDNSNAAIVNATRLIRRALASYRHWRTLGVVWVSFLTNSREVVRALLNSSIHAPHEMELILGWHVVQHVAPVTNRELATAYHSLGLGTTDVAETHKRFCTGKTASYFGVVSLSIFVRERFTEPVRRDIEVMARNIRRTYFSTLAASTYNWASLNATLVYLVRSQSRHASELVQGIGDILTNVVQNWRIVNRAYATIGDKLSWLLGKELMETGLYPFVTGNDTAILPTGITFPYYLPDVPAYLRYGTFATSLARVTARMFWQLTPKAAAEFQKCCSHSSGWNPPPEIMRRASGIEAAGIIYATATKSSGSGGDASSLHPEGEPPLPGLEQLSPRQLFYVSSCYLFCTGSKQISDECNEALRWSAAFAEAFKCAPGSRVVNKDRCSMFSVHRTPATVPPKRL